ncbi:FkbM family methyltransferase [Thermodesulfovibrio yellowstonii]|uniref:Methyltransferase FkbM domain-containing protein n=1 Tax=Thermodesulfovibrio yellowstonii TaxID=28262 RepID=A0A9W6GD93_9BACT|nr:MULTISPECIES: FkbM family methyltransferase [Thermodesulfovibrio]MDI6865164.1 FkbM family methyltransferase [Thermodesulfovibrio yellowstonii]GLI53093.1 hypothetical protein TISLANDTSLP1_07860 [Thermodesulfovibrio islandicus]
MTNKFDELLELFKMHDFPTIDSSSIGRLKDKKIILYGAGQGMQTFYNFVLNRYRIKARVVIDKKFKEKTYYRGIRAYPPSEFKISKKDMENSIVVITVTRPEYEREILEYLEDLGIQKNQIIFAKDFYEFNLPYLPEELQNEGFNFYLKNKDKILHSFELFSDNLSQEIFVNFLKTHMLKKAFPIPCTSSNEQYFPRDIKLKKGYWKIIHCGAFIGDTIRDLKKNVGKIKSLVCFEPDLRNFNLLRDYLECEKENIAEEIIILPCAVYSREKRLSFKSAGPESTLVERGKSIVQCVALDHVLINFEPTYITMDVEGTELEALKGSEGIIRKYKPDLAICVYHYPNHIWEIPLYIEQLNLGYKFYLRNHRGFTVETVLYATT